MERAQSTKIQEKQQVSGYSPEPAAPTRAGYAPAGESKYILRLMRALGNETRLGALRLLWDGREHCVCELMRALNATQSRMSRHMGELKLIGLVTDRRDAQWVRYRRAPQIPSETVRIIEAVLAASAESGAEAWPKC